MPRTIMFTVFAYDISDNKLRRKVAGVLEDSAVRVQNSVFEAWMSEKQANRLIKKIEKLLVAGDSLRVYVVGQSSLSRCHTFGGPAITGSPSFLII